MLLEQLREIVWKCNQDLPKNDLVKMTSGNVSGRDPDTGLVVIKPSGYSYEAMTPAHMVVVDLDGHIIDGDLKPSTDTDTHLYVYGHRPDVFGMVHTHSPYATSFAALGQCIPACLTASAMLGGDIPLGGYAPIGGAEIGQEIINKIGRASAIVMQNHGVFALLCRRSDPDGNRPAAWLVHRQSQPPAATGARAGLYQYFHPDPVSTVV